MFQKMQTVIAITPKNILTFKKKSPSIENWGLVLQISKKY